MLLAGVGFVLIALSACTTQAGPESTPTPTPTQSAAAGPEPVESLDALADTRWIGTDSEGDQITFGFESDGQLTFTSFGEKYSHETDRWFIEGDSIVWDATFGGPYGTCRYTGTLDLQSQVISASDVCSTGVESTTIELRQPVR